MSTMRKQQRLALHKETLRYLAGPGLGAAVRGGDVIAEPSVSTTASVKIGCTGGCPTPSEQETCGTACRTTGPLQQV